MKLVGLSFAERTFGTKVERCNFNDVSVDACFMAGQVNAIGLSTYTGVARVRSNISSSCFCTALRHLCNFDGVVKQVMLTRRKHERFPTLYDTIRSRLPLYA